MIIGFNTSSFQSAILVYDLASKSDALNRIQNFSRSIRDFLSTGLDNEGFHTLVKWAVVGLFIRLLVAPLFASIDLMTTAWGGLLLANGNGLVLANDPPALFLFFGGMYKLLWPILPSSAVATIISNTTYTPSFLHLLFRVTEPGMYAFILISKIPFFLFDFGTAFLLLKLVDDARRKLLVFKVWMLSPFAIFISYLFGQYDIIPTFFLVVSIVFLKKKNYGASFLALGVSSAFKVFGLLLFPFYLILFIRQTKTGFQKIKNLFPKILKTALYLLLLVLPLFIIDFTASIRISSFYEGANMAYGIGNYDLNGFYGTTLYSRGQTGQPLFSGLILFVLDYSSKIETLQGFPDVIYVFPLLYALFVLLAFSIKHLDFEKTIALVLMLLLAYYSFTLFHAQWFLWMQPFFILAIAYFGGALKKLYLLTIPFFFLYTLLWDSLFNIQLLFAIIPQAFTWPGPIAVLNSFGLPAMEIFNVSRSIFSAVMLFTALITWRIVSKKNLFSSSTTDID
jgi:hypothetical protein